MERSSNVRAAAAVALLGSGLLAGAFVYGLANVDPTFAAVPLDVHLAFRVQLMTRNGIVMQTLMAVSFVGAVWFAVAARGRLRACAAGAAALSAVTFVVTRFGNVPINDEVRAWQAGALAPDFQERLQVWGVLNDIRVTTAVAAFALLVVAAVVARTPETTGAAR